MGLTHRVMAAILPVMVPPIGRLVGRIERRAGIVRDHAGTLGVMRATFTGKLRRGRSMSMGMRRRRRRGRTMSTDARREGRSRRDDLDDDHRERGKLSVEHPDAEK